MMYRLQRNDADCFAINDVRFVLMCLQAHIISTSDSIGEATLFARKSKHHRKKQAKGEAT